MHFIDISLSCKSKKITSAAGCWPLPSQRCQQLHVLSYKIDTNQLTSTKLNAEKANSLRVDRQNSHFSFISTSRVCTGASKRHGRRHECHRPSELGDALSFSGGLQE
jgi:hypothetical protein